MRFKAHFFAVPSAPPEINIAVLPEIIGTLSAWSLKKTTRKLIEISGVSNALTHSATAEIDTVRAFNASSFLSNLWTIQLEKVQGLRLNIEARQNGTQTIIQTVTALMSVLVVATGATLVVAGKLDVGAMIGANILAARALIPISNFSQLGATFAEASESISILKEFSKMPLESNYSSFKPLYKGGLEFRDVSVLLPGATTPLFESLPDLVPQ